MECKRCGAYNYSRKSNLCSKCRHDLKINKAVESARMRAKNLQNSTEASNEPLTVGNICSCQARKLKNNINLNRQLHILLVSKS